MSDSNQQAGTIRAEERADKETVGLGLADLIPGYGMRDTEGAKIFVYLEPHAGSSAEGRARGEFELPGGKTVSDYDDTLLGLKRGGKGNEWKAAETVIRERFVDLHDMRPGDDAAIKAQYGSWKDALLKELALRPLAKALASLYIRRCRVQGSVDAE